MAAFLKVFLKGLIYTVLSPIILLVWVLYGAYLILIFIFELFKNIILFFTGIDTTGDLKEDKEAKRMILEAEKEKDQAQQAQQVAGAFIQNMMNQMNAQQSQPFVQPAPQQIQPEITAQPIEVNVEPIPEQIPEASENTNSWDDPYHIKEDDGGAMND